MTRGQDSLVIALVQADVVWEDVMLNIEQHEKRLERARGADVIVMPELFVSGFTTREKRRVASRYREVVKWMLAYSLSLDALLVGSTIYRSGNQFFNRLVVTFPDGRVLYYDKRHLFAMGGEDQHFTAGQERLTFLYKGVSIAVFTCYDLRFPAWCRNTTGYDLAIFVANWPAARRQAWDVLLKARAIENQAYVAGVNRVGRDGNGVHYAGDSAVISPEGHVVGTATPDADEVMPVAIDLAAARATRERFPVLRDMDKFQLEQ